MWKSYNDIFKQSSITFDFFWIFQCRRVFTCFKTSWYMLSLQKFFTFFQSAQLILLKTCFLSEGCKENLYDFFCSITLFVWFYLITIKLFIPEFYQLRWYFLSFSKLQKFVKLLQIFVVQVSRSQVDHALMTDFILSKCGIKYKRTWDDLVRAQRYTQRAY